LLHQVDHNDPLIHLANKINWQVFEDSFSGLYCHNNGRPAKPIRLMVGLLLLKQLENLSDERIVVEFKRNVVYQYFCGKGTFAPNVPCNATEFVHFRKRIGIEGAKLIFKQSVAIHNKKLINEETILIDTHSARKKHNLSHRCQAGYKDNRQTKQTSQTLQYKAKTNIHQRNQTM
jgi:IS5 family transposase